ncbi:membrane protein insertion efficiency factor YidD [Dethiobacter alkaliphilus]|uniref:membrane protein insertion efficiency factor YidD n=1 Tax=Dethiobacter alkaliphilus TaxID=427926 RepID=UPI0023EE81E7|nr:membrane protein insertion efficiency factor YidD [Dethiobacter alkaliphilus]
MKWPLIALIWIYQKFISPMKRPSCRFYPSCSQYALEALQRYGFIRGTIMALWRLLRCNPFNPGGYDPVESQNKGGH